MLARAGWLAWRAIVSGDKMREQMNRLPARKATRMRSEEPYSMAAAYSLNPSVTKSGIDLSLLAVFETS
jgi:hypothetical protein